MQQLSETESSFLFLETEKSPLQIAVVLLLDDLGSRLDLGRLKNQIDQRLHKAPRFRQRLVTVPLKLDNPYWADDTEYETAKHLRHQRLPTPGRLNQLLRAVSEDLSRPLDPAKPLWEVTLYTGLADIDRAPEASCALYFKVHQSMIDGGSGEELVSALLDSSETPADETPPPTWKAASPPSRAQLLGQAYGRALTVPRRWAVLAKDAASASFYQSLIHKFRQLSLPSALFNAPVASFNRPIDEARNLDCYTCRFEHIRHLKQKAPGVSTNALLMTLCSEALRRYLAYHGEQLHGSLTALTPVSVRSKRIESPTGSQLAAMISYLATDQEDLASRLLTIHLSIEATDTYQQAVATDHITRLAPSSLLGLAARTYSEFLLAQRHKPVFNLPITNIPGPKRPLYIAGTKLIHQINSTPLFDGLGLSLAIMTYRDRALISLTASPRAVPDLSVLTRQFDESLQALASSLEQADWESMLANPDQYRPKNLSLWSALLEDSQSIIQRILSQWSGRDRRKEPREQDAAPESGSESEEVMGKTSD